MSTHLDRHVDLKHRSLSVDLSRMRVLITGGSRGIAAALVRAFAANGADVAFSYAAMADKTAGHDQAAAELRAETAGDGRRIVAIEADLTKPGAARLLATQAESILGGIDTVVLSASLQVHKSFLAMLQEDVARQFQINLTANIELLQQVLPSMRAQGWGRVISIGSVQELAPSAEMPIYAMTKAALENLVRNLAVENAPYGITVNNIAPGLIETDRNAFRRTDMDEWKRLTRRANPMQRAGQPDDIAGAALFLASSAASFVTAATIHVTGGGHVPRGANDPPNDAKPASSAISRVEPAAASI